MRTPSPRMQNGKLSLLAPGTILPTGLLNNRDPDSEHFNENEYHDNFMLVRGPVKRLYKGDFQLEGEGQDTYIRCIIDTEFGELELDHTYEQVPEKMRGNIRVGATVSCVCVLSGDVAIYEYENGLVLNEEHDLMAVRYAFSGGDPQRILSIFAPDAKLRGEGRPGEATVDKISSFFRELGEIVKSKNGTITARMARVASVRDAAATKYAPGKRCLAVYVSVPAPSTDYVFIDVNSSGKITEIYFDSGKNYQFKLDEEPPENKPFEDFKVPESVVEPLFNRAQFHGLLDPGMTLEEVTRALEGPSGYAGHFMKILAEKPRDLLTGEKKYFANLFGYVFAKSAELEYANTHRRGLFKLRPAVTVTPGDAWAGRYGTAFAPEIGKELEKLMELGKQFQKDYTFYRERNGLEAHGNDPDFDLALRTVCLFGAIYTREHLK